MTNIYNVNHENPIRLYRKEHRLTQVQLAEHLQVTEQTVRRAEQGTFNSLPPVFDMLPPTTSTKAMSDKYNEWVMNKRDAVREAIEMPSVDAIVRETPMYSHPLQTLRAYSIEQAKDKGIVGRDIKEDSVAGFAKLVAINPESITEAEASYSEPRNNVYLLLQDLGYNYMEIARFVRR